MTRKLSNEQVKDIRERVAAGTVALRLAEEYGVTSALVSQYVCGKVRRDAGGPIKGEDYGVSGLRGRRGHVITGADAKAIRFRAAAGERYADIAPDYGISVSFVSQIVTGRSWRDAGGPVKRRDYVPERRVVRDRQPLTAAIVEDIRERYAALAATGGQLADEYGISRAAVNQIIRGAYWKTAGGPILNVDYRIEGGYRNSSGRVIWL